MPQDIWSTLFYVVIMVGVLLAAYYTTKFLSNRAGRMIKSRHLQIVDRIGVGRDKMLVVAKVGKKYLLLGVTNQNITALGEIDPEDFSAATTEESNSPADGGPISKFASFLANAKSAPENLQKARMAAQKARHSAPVDPQDVSEDDMLEQISQAIHKRKSRSFKPHDDGGKK